MNKEGISILRERKKFTFHQGYLYHHHTLAAELEEILQFLVPMVHRVAAMNRCHRDARHQGQWQMLSVLQDQFWWPGMVRRMQKVISSCERYSALGCPGESSHTSYSGHLSFGAASCGFHWQ